MNTNEYPFNNESLLKDLCGFSKVNEIFQLYLGDHELRIELLEQINPKNFTYQLYERKTVSDSEEKTDAWVFVTHFPYRSEDTGKDALGEVLQQIKEYYPKK